MDDAHRGEAALNAKNFPEAIACYTAAIERSPAAAPYYIKRSAAYQRSKSYDAALNDANLAVTLATQRAKRELMAQAQLRRGIALFSLQRFGDAKACFGWAKKLDGKEKLIGIWEGQVNGKLAGLPAGDHMTAVAVLENPMVGTPTAVAPAATAAAVESTKATKESSTAAVLEAPAAPAGQTPADKIRHEWYQNTEKVYVTLLAKGVPKEQASIDIDEQSVSVSFPLVTGSSYDFSLDPLYAPIDTQASSYKVLPTKIELVFQKSTPGQKWSALEGSSKSHRTTSTGPVVNAETTISAATESKKPAGPSYPTSSRTGPKNWDKIANSYSKPQPAKKVSPKSKDPTEQSATASPGSNSDDADAKEKDDEDIYVDDDEDGGDEVNAFFKKLYAGSSDETKRAMMKSYQESGGTALSTNWEDVKKGPVPVSPPDGMEAKKWEV